MATGQVDSGCGSIKRIVILEDSAATAENQIEVSYQLSKKARRWLASASEVCLTLVAGTEVGAATFDLESLVESRDDTNFRTVENFTDVTVDAAGEFRVNLTKRIMAEYVKVMVGAVTLTGSAYFPITIALECTIDPAKYGA